METATILLGRDDVFRFLVHGDPARKPLAQQSRLVICTKDDGTEKHRPIAVMAFNVVLPDGSVQAAQCTVTVAILAAMGAALKGRYGPGGPQAHRYGDDNPFV